MFHSIRCLDEVITPDGTGLVVEFDPNDHGGRDVLVRLNEEKASVWFHHSQCRPRTPEYKDAEYHLEETTSNIPF